MNYESFRMVALIYVAIIAAATFVSGFLLGKFIF
jgi:hypothetical protein